MSGFYLAGGTNLALCLGHRKSIDLDLFSPNSFDGKALEKHLTEKYDFRVDDVRERDTVKGAINTIKIDAIAHIYPLLKKPVVVEGIRLYSLPDIAAMKLVAISDNGTRLKDFVDIAYMSTKMSLSEMLASYAKKYPNSSSLHALKGLSYFNDIDFEVKIELMHDRFDWSKIEKRIKEMIKYENKIFENPPL